MVGANWLHILQQNSGNFKLLLESSVVDWLESLSWNKETEQV